MQQENKCFNAPPNIKMVIYGMGRMGKKILKKLEVDGCSQHLGSRRIEWGSERPTTTETLLLKGFTLSPGFTLQSKGAEPKQIVLGVLYNHRAQLRELE